MIPEETSYCVYFCFRLTGFASCAASKGEDVKMDLPWDGSSRIRGFTNM